MDYHNEKISCWLTKVQNKLKHRNLLFYFTKKEMKKYGCAYGGTGQGKRVSMKPE